MFNGIHHHILKHLGPLHPFPLPKARPVILLGERPNSRRLEKSKELQRDIQSRYPNSTLLIFNGERVSLNDLFEFFGHADIFVSPHGAGFSNMLFMKNTSTLIEIIPEDYQENCFEVIAKLFGLKRHAIVGKGQLNSELQLNPQKLQMLLDISFQAIQDFQQSQSS